MTKAPAVSGGQVERQRRPYAVAPGEGEARWVLGELASFEATTAQTGGGFALKETRDKRGGAAPVHVHEREDAGYWGSGSAAQPDVGRMAEAAASYGVTVLGPPPGPAGVAR